MMNAIFKPLSRLMPAIVLLTAFACPPVLGNDSPVQAVSPTMAAAGFTLAQAGVGGPPAGALSKADWEIERDVRRELFRNPDVESEDIEIAVKEGVVQLTGTVGSWSERDAAEQSARAGGARSVDNDLAIDKTPETEQP